jgi:endonuclease/exonuclease/phosphatase (EEP) superfamily protein YafD
VLVRNGIEVVDAAVLDEVGSDHRPVRATLRLR